MFQIKICGVTTAADAREACAAGADALGLNFYPHSPRFLTAEAAQHVAAAIPPAVTRVGVFVNAPAETICAIYDALGLDVIQLHGDEPPEFLAELGRRPAMRAFRVGAAGLAPVVDYLHACSAAHVRPKLLLLDAQPADPQQYGGAGTTADWGAIAAERDRLGNLPLVLAGGLTSENVAAAIARVRPSAVDVASGVESAPGRKDSAKMKSFVAAAKAALEQYPSPT
jgi:phosphoribosylanthranilate isomerase